jgi:hypothetical protein
MKIQITIKESNKTTLNGLKTLDDSCDEEIKYKLFDVSKEQIWKFTKLQGLYDIDNESIFIMPDYITENDLNDAIISPNGDTKTLAGLYTQDFLGGLILRLSINNKEYNCNEYIGNLSDSITDLKLN